MPEKKNPPKRLVSIFENEDEKPKQLPLFVFRVKDEDVDTFIREKADSDRISPHQLCRMLLEEKVKGSHEFKEFKRAGKFKKKRRILE